MGIIGNDQADIAACSVTTQLSLAVLIYDMKHVILHCIQMWQESRNLQTNNKLYSEKTHHWSFVRLMKRTDIKLTRLHTGHTHFTQSPFIRMSVKILPHPGFRPPLLDLLRELCLLEII
ncbi:hypothetical protein TNCV_4358171 [Trichonephila clavipes]|nr:hypothetical protein TNCV_4358171 [Trichonephila clavipes]